MRRTIAIAVATAVLIAVSYLMRPDPVPPRGAAQSAPPPGSAEVEGTGLSQAPSKTSQSEIDRLIHAYEERAKTTPNVSEYTLLGELYVTKARSTGDVATYARAEESLERALAIAPEYTEAQSLLASVRFTTHDFVGALQLANEVLTEKPRDFGALAVAGDAQLELGRYEEAKAIYARLSRLLPGTPAVDVRVARFAWLTGEVDEALRHAAQATSSARRSGIFGAGLAWYQCFEARIHLDRGDYDEAARLYESARKAAPDYHVALAGLARARAAQGRILAAISLYESAIRIVPEPDYLAALGDLFAVRGQEQPAQEQYDTVDVVAKLAEINRQVFNRQLAVFYADHQINPAAAVELAASELTVRKDVYGYDAYAWALYRNERFKEAREASDEALALGTPDARLLYHSGLIWAALGNDELARTDLERALQISPRFDPLHARVARRTLSSLGGAR
jgi:tetratricopeptide (TPR) repeat protein